MVSAVNPIRPFLATLLLSGLGSVADAQAPRPTTPPAAAPARTLPQACDQDPFDIQYGPIRRGSLVRLGRHRSIDGSANWDPAMEHYVGRVTPVVAARGLDPQGCSIVQVAADGGEYVWRVRDLEVVADAPPEEEAGRPPEIRLEPGGLLDPRVFEGQLGAVTREADDVRDGCAGYIGTQPTFTLLVPRDMPMLSILVHSNVDTVLVIRTPGGRIACVDDVDARDPVISGRAAAGRYEVFVGTFESGSGTPSFRVGLSERGSVRAPLLAGVDARDIRPLGPEGDGPSPTHLQPGRPVRSSPDDEVAEEPGFGEMFGIPMGATAPSGNTR